MSNIELENLLEYASENNIEVLVRKLLSFGVRSEFGIKWASIRGHENIVRIYETYGVKL